MYTKSNDIGKKLKQFIISLSNKTKYDHSLGMLAF